MVMSVKEIDQLLEQWEMNVRDLHRRVILAPTPRERERWHSVWLLAQGWTASSTAEALGRDPHTIGRWSRPVVQAGGPGRWSRPVVQAGGPLPSAKAAQRP